MRIAVLLSVVASVSGGDLTVRGTSGADDVVIGQAGSGEAFVPGAEPGAGCEPSEGGALCLGVVDVLVRLGPGDDEFRDSRGVTYRSVTVRGGSGDDSVSSKAHARRVVGGGAGDDQVFTPGPNPQRTELFGGAGRDFLRGSGGRDRFFMRDGERDRLSCAGARDVLRADSGLDQIIRCA